MKTILTPLILVVCCASLVSQPDVKMEQPAEKKISVTNSPPSDPVESTDILEPEQMTTHASPFTSFEFLLSIIVLFFGLIVVSLEVYLASKGVIRSEYAYKCIIITLVIVGSIVLITAGYSNNQINGVIGILGSIAGYMLAKGTTQQTKS